MLVAACSSATSPTADLGVVTTLSRAEFRAGDAIDVSITVTNHGTASRELNIATCPDPFIVTTEDGTVVGPALRGCTLELRTRDLRPGESFTYALLWLGDARSARHDQPQQIAPGNIFCSRHCSYGRRPPGR